MSDAIKFPSARQPAVYQDEVGNWLFTRVWFLFFQAQYIKTGGALPMDTFETIDDVAPAAGIGPDVGYMLQRLIQDIDQNPRPDVYSGSPVDDVAPALIGLQDQINELRTMINSLQQGTQVL